MTGYTVHTGSSVKFSTGWDNIFRATPAKKESAEAVTSSVKATKKTAKKSAAKAVKKTSASSAKTKTATPSKKSAAAKAVKRGK